MNTDSGNELKVFMMRPDWVFTINQKRCSRCARIGVHDGPEYAGAGRQVSFLLDIGREENYTNWMKDRVDSDYGKQVYAHRMSVVEPVFGNIGTAKKLNRFSLRSKKKVQGQWQLFCMVHNIEKIKNYGNLAA